MSDLSTAHKSFIVKQLAMGETPTEVAEAVKDVFGIEITRQQVHSYDPTAPGKRARKWMNLYRAEQRKFRKAIDAISTSHLATRLLRLERMAKKAEALRNYPLAAQLLKQIAEEIGGVYTNRHKLEHTGAGGKPLAPRVINVRLVRPGGSPAGSGA